MIKLITPPGMLVTVALLAIYSAYASWTAFIEKSWIYAIVALVSLAACVGTAFPEVMVQISRIRTDCRLRSGVVLLGLHGRTGWLLRVLLFVSRGGGEITCTRTGARLPVAGLQLHCLASLPAGCRSKRGRSTELTTLAAVASIPLPPAPGRRLPPSTAFTQRRVHRSSSAQIRRVRTPEWRRDRVASQPRGSDRPIEWSPRSPASSSP